MEQPCKRLDERDGSAVTVSITRRVLPGREAAFEVAPAGINEVVSRFPGFLGMRVIRPVRGNREYRVVLRFVGRATSGSGKIGGTAGLVGAARSALRRRRSPTQHHRDGTGTPPRLGPSPLDSFVRTSVSGIGLLLLGTVAGAAHGQYRPVDTYERFWETTLPSGGGRR